MTIKVVPKSFYNIFFLICSIYVTQLCGLPLLLNIYVWKCYIDIVKEMEEIWKI